MELSQIVMAVTIALVMAVVFVKAYLWMRNGGAYYAQYPGAKLLDDAAKQGKLPAGGAETIIARVGMANDPADEVKNLRRELNLK